MSRSSPKGTMSTGCISYRKVKWWSMIKRRGTVQLSCLSIRGLEIISASSNQNPTSASTALATPWPSAWSWQVVSSSTSVRRMPAIIRSSSSEHWPDAVIGNGWASWLWTTLRWRPTQHRSRRCLSINWRSASTRTTMLWSAVTIGTICSVMACSYLWTTTN